MPLLTDHVAAALAAYSITDAFGVMGNGNAYFLDALSRTSIRFTAIRHEAGAVAAPDAYYRSTARLAVGTTTYGPGFTNAITALMESRMARIPLVLVVGEGPVGARRPWDIDQRKVLEGLGVPGFTVGRDRIVETVRAALTTAIADRTPVVIGIPYDLAPIEAGEIPSIPSLALPAPLQADTAEIAELATLLSLAQRPVLIAGRGAHLAQAGQALGQLAVATGALTSTTALVRGLFPEPRYDLGISGGFGQPDALSLIRTADLAVVFGAALNQFTMAFDSLFAPGTTVVQVDIQDQATNERVDRYLRGDARLVAEALAAAVAPRADPWRETIDLTGILRRDNGPADGVADDGRLDPRSAAFRLGQLLPRDRVVVSDGGHFMGWANTRWPPAGPGRMVMMGSAFLSIGLGLPGVAGAAAANPDAVVVCTTGDGGALMALADLETAIRTTGGRGITVVWNDAQYSAETTLYRDGLGLVEAPMLIPEVDFAALATTLGAEGVVVRTLADLDRLGDWNATAVAERRHLLLDLRIAKNVVAEYQREVVAQSIHAH